MVDPVVDLRVHMIRTARQHDDPFALTAGFVNDLAALDPNFCHVGLVLGIGCIGCLLHLFLRDAAEVLGQNIFAILWTKSFGRWMPT